MGREGEPNSDQAINSFFGNLTQARFDQVFDEEELERFQVFLKSKARPSGTFFIAYPLVGGSYALFQYEIEVENSKETIIKACGKVFLPGLGVEQNLSEVVAEKPIWYLGEDINYTSEGD